MKTLRNEEGYVLAIALFILSILTVMGTLAIHTSNTELRIARNHQIHHMNFYAAESGIALGPIWANGKDEDGNRLYPESEWSNIDFVGGGEGTHSNKTAYSYNVYPETGIDPSDGSKKVLRYGDENGDYLDEVNYTTGPPLIRVISDGTHQFHGGQVKLEGRYYFQPIFAVPNAALRVHSSVNGNGVSGSIIGEAPSGSSCSDVADIMYDVAGGVVEYGGDLGDTPLIEQSTGMYPLPLIDPVVRRKATEIIPGSNNLDEGYLNGLTDADNPGVLYVDGPGITSKTTNLSGYGILFVNGNFEFAGNLNWHGIIMVNGDITFSGGGSKTIYGSVVAGGEAVALNGSVDIEYDCELLNKLRDDMSSFRLTSWRQL